MTAKTLMGLLGVAVVVALAWANLHSQAAANAAAVIVAGATADKANAATVELTSKVDVISATNAKILDGLKELHEGQQSAAVASAVTNEHLAGLEKVVDRIEAKADAAK